MYSYKYPHFALTVDCIIFGLDEGELKVLLIQRDLEPFAGCWALPGGFVHPDESLDHAARRELQEETGVKQAFMEQLYTYGALDRDPRERVVSVAYFALVNLGEHRLQADTDARNAQWYALSELPELAFDHAQILKDAHERLRGKIKYQPIGFELLPPKFTLTQIQKLYEKVLGRQLDKRNFRKKILKMDILEGLDEKETNVPRRAAQLYQFNREQYDAKARSGFNFDLQGCAVKE